MRPPPQLFRSLVNYFSSLLVIGFEQPCHTHPICRNQKCRFVPNRLEIEGWYQGIYDVMEQVFYERSGYFTVYADLYTEASLEVRIKVKLRIIPNFRLLQIPPNKFVVIKISPHAIYTAFEPTGLFLVFDSQVNITWQRFPNFTEFSARAFSPYEASIKTYVDRTSRPISYETLYYIKRNFKISFNPSLPDNMTMLLVVLRHIIADRLPVGLFPPPIENIQNAELAQSEQQTVHIRRTFKLEPSPDRASSTPSPTRTPSPEYRYSPIRTG